MTPSDLATMLALAQAVHDGKEPRLPVAKLTLALANTVLELAERAQDREPRHGI